MTVVICERCGKTNQGREINIERVSIRARMNGNEESSFDGSIEACQECRAQIHDELRKLTQPEGNLIVSVQRVTK
jgi:hypothetical protein